MGAEHTTAAAKAPLEQWTQGESLQACHVGGCLYLENAEADLTPMICNLIHTPWDEWKTVERQIEDLGEKLERIFAADYCSSTSAFEAIHESLASEVDPLE